MQLDVQVRINPPPSEIPLEELNKLFAGEVERFERWFIERQQAAGHQAVQLISAEHAIIRSFMYYIYTRET
jgi:hypothetical protein